MLLPVATVELVWQDDSGSTAATYLYCPSSLTVIEIDAFATAAASILVPLTDAVLIKQRIKYKWAPDERGIASGGASIKDTGSFFFSTGEENPIELIVVRSLKPELVETTGTGAGIVIDATNSYVIAFEDAVVDGIFVNPFNDDIDGFLTAYKQSRV